MRRVAFAVLFLLLDACAPVVGHPPLPPMQAEEIPLPPTSRVEVIWRPGYYDWNGTEYVWVPGEWVERAGHGTTWQDGYWNGAPPNSVWVPAHWL